MTFEEVLNRFKEHPQGKLEKWDDWEYIVGEMLFGGGSPSYEEMQAVCDHFGQKNPMIPPGYDRFNMPPEGHEYWKS